MVETVTWAGVSFTPLHHHDGRFFRTPGLYGLVHDAGEKGRLLLFVGQADNLAVETSAASRTWVDALRLGMNELHVLQPVERRVDRLQLLSRIVRHEQPILNVVEEAHPEPGAQAAPVRRRA